MKILYLANIRIPTEMAHGLQIMKMCEAFSKYKRRDTQIESRQVGNTQINAEYQRESAYSEGGNQRVSAANIEVELIVPRKFSISELGKKDPFEYYKVEKKFKIKKLFCIDLTPLNKYLGPISFLVQALSFSIVSAIYILVQRITKKITKNDIVYGRDRLDLLFMKKPFIFEIHKLHKTLDNYISKRASKIVVITQELKKDLIGRGINENKIFVASDAVDLNLFNINKTQKGCRGELGLPLDKKIILYTGHLYKWKGVETLALASRYLGFSSLGVSDPIPNPQSLIPNYLIVIVGGIKWYLSDFKKFVKENDLKNVLIVGHKDYAQIPYYLGAADCLVLTGTKASETSQKYTSPMKMFEYMASKKPIVASELPSFKEILNQENCIFVESDNSEAMAIGIKKALNDSILSKQISEQAFKDVQKYTWDNRAKEILKFITN